MSDAHERPQGGFGYWVSDEQLAAFARLTPLQRLKWVDDARRFTLLAQTPETRERQARLRRGGTIV
ncbi:MAG: hypothetical protein PHQ14_10400 [Chromatiales bacterium]|jgi:hypothetical protein|nr:hypothetical protein [Chromatiales bacterium]MDX9768536.1 hypothetical protein [Ectothiorhodospiraceae bacterium]